MEPGDGKPDGETDYLDEAEVLLNEIESPKTGNDPAKPTEKKTESIQVMLRVRPENMQEIEQNADICLQIEGITDVTITAGTTNGAHVQSFHFDRVFHSHTDQQEVYDFTCRDLVADCMNGINAAVIGDSSVPKTNFTDSQLARSVRPNREREDIHHDGWRHRLRRRKGLPLPSPERNHPAHDGGHL